MTDEFDLWYYGEGEDKGYPRKKARGDAKRAFAQARKVASLNELIEGRKRYAEAERDTEAKFTRLPATWLRGEGWADETEATPGEFGHRMTTDEALKLRIVE